MSEKIKTYQPDNSLKRGYLFIFKEIFCEFKDNSWLTFQLFKRDFFSIYKQSFIGVFWSLIIPVVSVVTFIVLNRSGIFSIGSIDVPYPIYALLGLAFWQLFSTGLIAGSNSLVKAGSVIVRINFSKKSLVIASFSQSLVSFLIQWILLAMLFIYYHVTPNIGALLIPLVIMPLVLFSLGLAFILSVFNGVFRDVGNSLSIVITFLMFLTPVFYTKPKLGALVSLTKYNPLYYLVSAPRDLVLKGAISEWKGFLVASIFSIIVFIICLVIFHLTETRVAERV